MPKFIGIKQLWYGDVISVATNLTQSGVAALISASTEIKNVHQDTWGYTEDDPSTTDYKNELSGLTYFRDVTEKGNKTINFTMGEYDYETKAALMGGTIIQDSSTPPKTVGWKSDGSLELIHKSIIALTKTGTYIIFTNANIVAKSDQQQKAIGLGVNAVAEENPAAGVEDEYWFDVLPSA